MQPIMASSPHVSCADPHACTTGRYYENDDLPYARKRWVLFKDTFDYNPTSVSPEWHGWLNGVNDFAPTR